MPPHQVFHLHLRQKQIIIPFGNEEEKKSGTKLELNHNKPTEFFKPLRIDRNYDRAGFLDAGLRFIEPLDVRDQFKELLNISTDQSILFCPIPVRYAYFMEGIDTIKVLKNKVIPLLMEYFSGKTEIVEAIFKEGGWIVRFDPENYDCQISLGS